MGKYNSLTDIKLSRAQQNHLMHLGKVDVLNQQELITLFTKIPGPKTGILLNFIFTHSSHPGRLADIDQTLVVCQHKN